MIYSLAADSDDPRYSGFEYDMNYFRTVPIKRSGLDFKIVRRAETWITPHVSGKVDATNHYPCINLIFPAFSEQAVEALEHFLTKNGELLPISSVSGTFIFYNVTTLADVLDPTESDIAWSKPGILASIIKSTFSVLASNLTRFLEFRKGPLLSMSIKALSIVP